MKVGLALSGGGTRGFAHVGVLKALVEHGIPIDAIAGTSAGSIVGGAFAAGMSPDELLKMAYAVRWTNMARPSFSPLGVLSNSPMAGFVIRHFPVLRIEECKIPFAVVSAELSTGKEVIFTSGPLEFAIRTSCAVPGVFVPVQEPGGRRLVDGGIVSPLPVRTARAMGADIVIGVDLNECGARFRHPPRTAMGCAIQSTMMMLRALSRTQHAEADIVLAPQVAHLRPDRLGSRDECIAIGQAAAEERIDEIKPLVSSK
jgi:NTE family protein